MSIMNTENPTTPEDPTEPAPHPALAGSIWRLVLVLAWPALMQQGLLLSIQLYDQYLAGPFSEAHKAALTTANYLYWFVSAYAVVVNAGATALVGRFVGQRDLVQASRAMAQAMMMAGLFGTAGAVAALWGMDGIIQALNLRPEAGEYFSAYLTPLAYLLPFYMIEVGGIACLIGAGDTRTGLKVLATVATVNVPAAWVLSRGWGESFSGIGFVGIAWGTGLSHLFGCGLVVATLLRGRYGLRLHFGNLLPDFSLIYRLLRVSIPAAMDSLSNGFFQLAFLRIVISLGDTAAGAHGIAIRLEGLGYLAGVALGTATAAIIARALGAKRPDLAARGGWASLVFAVGLMSLMGATFYTLARPMFLVFCPDPDQEAVVELGVKVLRLIAFAMPALAATIVLTQALRAAGDTRVPLVFTWIGFLGIRLPLAYLFTSPEYGYNLGLFGAWLAMSIDIWARGLFFVGRFATGGWKKIKV